MEPWIAVEARDMELSKSDTAVVNDEQRARLVKCSGEGLHFLYVDIPSDIIVDTSLAGQGLQL